MTKQEILDYFKDVNVMYNDSIRYDTLSYMLDELLKEQDTVDHAIEILRNNGWIEHKGSYPKDKFALVVRCKDCIKHHNELMCHFGGWTPSEWYCADGVRDID